MMLAMLIGLERVLSQVGSDIKLIAKIERLEALKQYWIIKASDGIMVARGDLALESGPWRINRITKKYNQTDRKRKESCDYCYSNDGVNDCQPLVQREQK